MRTLPGIMSAGRSQRWSRILLLVALCTVVGLSVSLAPAPAAAQASNLCPNPCPPGQLCCHACAVPGCTRVACLTAINGRCPLIP